MESAGAAGIATLVGFLIGLLIGGAVGGLLVMLGVRVVKKTSVSFGNAFLAVVAAGVAGLVLGFAFGFGWAMAGLDTTSPVLTVAGIVLGFVVTVLIYMWMLRPQDGSRVTFVQAILIYLVQLAIVLAIAVAIGGLLMVTGVDMTQITGAGGY